MKNELFKWGTGDVIVDWARPVFQCPSARAEYDKGGNG